MRIDDPIILAIDDNQDNLTTLRAVVADTLPGARTLTALSGQEGIALARRQQPDVILLDIVMPGLDGFQVCRLLKADEELKHIPVVFLTALKAGRDSRIQALEAGGDGFLAKPLDESELKAQILAMVKIKAANDLERRQKRHLADLVAQRTHELERELVQRRQAETRLQQANQELAQSQRATLELLDDLRLEVEAHRQSQAELRRGEEKYRGIFETLQDVYFEITQDGAILEISPSVERLLGYPRQELIGESIVPLYADPQRRLQAWELMRRDGKVFDFEVEFRDRAGAVVPCSVTADLVDDGPGQPLRSRGLFRDISERRRGEQALRASEELLRSIFEQAAVGMSLLTPDGKWLQVNQRLCDILGYTREELMQLTYRDVTHPEEVTRDVTRVARIVEGNEKNACWEKRYIRKDGRVIWVRLTTAMIRDQSGQAQYFVTVTEDITEAKQHEEELNKSQAFNAGIIDSSADCIKVLDLQGRLQYMSPGGLRLMGMADLSPVQGVPYQDLWDREDKAKVLWALESARGGQRGTFQGLCPTIDGQLKWWDVTVTPIRGAEGGVESLLAVSRDITETRRAGEERSALEAQLRQAQKMEAIGTLAGGIAHDFNNILAAVLGFAEMALEDARQGQVKLPDLEQIMLSAQRARDLVQQILAFSRKKDPDLKPLSLNQVVRHTQQILERTLPKMIHIQSHLAQDLPLILGDPTQVEQVLLNLAANARDAMPEGGRLVLESSRIVLEREYCLRHLEMRPGVYAMLMVSDSGQGMAPEVREHVFEPFYTTKEIGKGTGLGLSSAYGIVKNHGGHIHCYSEPGQGTLFKIFLPAFQERLASPDGDQAPPPQQPTGQGESILLVDDEETLRRFGQRALQSKGYRVLTATSGEEAVESFRSETGRPDLVVMDLGMPGMGGHKALKEILTLCPQAKVVIASGYSAELQVKQSLEAGAAGYVAKPFRLAELLSTVRKVLDGA